MADLGFPNSVVEAIDIEFQKAIWEVRKSGLNIMMYIIYIVFRKDISKTCHTITSQDTLQHYFIK